MIRIREELTPDGATKIFQTSGSYVSNSVFIFWNGQLMPKDFVTELTGRFFEIAEVVDADESLSVEYTPLL